MVGAGNVESLTRECMSGLKGETNKFNIKKDKLQTLKVNTHHFINPMKTYKIFFIISNDNECDIGILVESFLYILHRNSIVCELC